MTLFEREEVEVKIAKINYADGTSNSVQFYDSIMSESGISFMLSKDGDFDEGVLTPGEFFVPFTAIRNITCVAKGSESRTYKGKGEE